MHDDSGRLVGPGPGAWHRVGSRRVFTSPWVDLREDEVELPGGKRIRHAVITLGSGQCVGALPLTATGRLVLVRQYRYVQQGWFWEMPTGGMAAGEPREAAVQRELREETGFAAGVLRHLTSFQTSKSVCREVAHLFLATDLRRDPLPPDETEAFEVAEFTPAQALAMVERAEIEDSMTVVALLFAARAGLLPD